MTEQYGNDITSALAASITSGATTLTVTTGQGAKFAATGNFRLRIDSEYLLCTSRAGDVLTVTRGIEGSTAAAHAIGSIVEQIFTAAALLAIIQQTAMVKIAESVAGSAVANFNLASIPATYRQLVLEYVLRGDAAANTTILYLNFNNDFGNNYDTEYTYGQGATSAAVEILASGSGGQYSIPAANATAGAIGMGTIIIPDYMDTSWNKVALLRNANKFGVVTTDIISYTGAVWWRSSAAINQLTLTATPGNFVANSRVTLWGVPA